MHMWENKHPYIYKQSMGMISILETYEKAIKVIDSCQNEIHLDVAINYCNNFKNQFTKLGGDDVLIGIYYNELMDLIAEKLNETYSN